MGSLTLLEVVGFPDVDAHQSHELELRKALAGWGRQGEQVPQVTDLCVDQVTPQLAGPLGRLAGIEAARSYKRKVEQELDFVFLDDQYKN